MAKPTSPHTQSQQNTNFAQTDFNPDELPETVAEQDGTTYENREGAQTGAGRSPKHAPATAKPHNTEPQMAGFEGTVTSRVSDDATRQGISNRSAQSEKPGQQKVVSARDDAQAGVNHSGKVPPQSSNR